MKLGTENRKQLIALGVLLAIAAFTVTRMLWPSAPPPATASRQTPLPQSLARPAARRTASGKAIKPAEPRLDPTLDLDLLHQTEDTKYAGSGRNIFVAGAAPRIETAHGNGTTDKKPPYT